MALGYTNSDWVDCIFTLNTGKKCWWHRAYQISRFFLLIKLFINYSYGLFFWKDFMKSTLFPSLNWRFTLVNVNGFFFTHIFNTSPISGAYYQWTSLDLSQLKDQWLYKWNCIPCEKLWKLLYSSVK